MKRKRIKVKVRLGVGSERIKAVVKTLRKEYGPMLKRLAVNEEQSPKA